MGEFYKKATPRPWRVINYDAGDRSYYNYTPGIFAPEEEDCGVIHWDGFEQEFWQSANGDQRAIHANAALIVHAVNSVEALEARVKALEEALTASSDTKAAYMGDFTFTIMQTEEDEDGDLVEMPVNVHVPWTTIKEIMSAILARATLPEGEAKGDGDD